MEGITERSSRPCNFWPKYNFIIGGLSLFTSPDPRCPLVIFADHKQAERDIFNQQNA